MVQFYYSDDNKHKYMAIFDNPYQVVRFGAKGYQDFTEHRDPNRKMLYLKRHHARENWNDPRSAGALSRWILWNKPDIDDAIEDYVERFKMYIA